MNSRSQGGFTLLELILAVTIMALVMAVVAGVIAGVLVGAERVGEKADRDLVAGEIDDLIADDLAFIAVPSCAQAFTITGKANGNSFLTFYSAAGAKAAWGELATPLHVVTYRVEPLERGGKGLFREEVPIVTSNDAYYDGALLVAGALGAFRVEAFDGSQWHSRWPDEGAAGLPALIRVTLTLEEPGEAARTIFVESAPSVEYVIRPGAAGAADESEGGKDPDKKTADKGKSRSSAAPLSPEGGRPGGGEVLP
ncbi:MAG: prepilin-type N-terminal cleavage/methylation domain-containing protein [Planctomycetes bacterium]|nr:prepilin-type N-terminal cleavage/methylation domain-containing protein [Planctomycetota bacterium]